MNDTVITCTGLTRRFVMPRRGGAGSDVLALDDVSLQVPRGQLVALAGPSGSGKSTLLALIGALDWPTAGTITVNDFDVAAMSRRARRAFRRRWAISMMPQPADNLLLASTGRENVLLAAKQRRVRGNLQEKADEVLARMQLTSFAHQPCAVMSGGEQQRIALASCLLGAAAVILADEPTGALDRTGAATVIDALAAATAGGVTVVVATHDPNVVAAADTVIRLDHGRRVE
ncbi:MAG: ATP-binding cassette domain-containing protein [Actinomycetota bacterium]|nr:ATP-binding cassette domain-containing protein [Actinomycetota bacterium]